jgi:PAS domain S-box-containing protein
MKVAPRPVDEDERLAELHSLNILDTPSEERFDRITRLALRIFDVPIALVSLVDGNRQWFKSCQGLLVSETPRGISFCGHAIIGEDVFLVEDARLDPRFSDNPLVTDDPHVTFYAGQPVRGPQGHKLGTLCIIDHRPRHMNPKDLQALRDLAAWVENELSVSQLRNVTECLPDGMIIFDEHGKIELMNPEAQRIFDHTTDEVIGQNMETLIPGSASEERLAQLREELHRSGARCFGERRETQGLRKDGSEFPVEIVLSAMRWARRVQFIGMVHDLTAKKQAEEQLRIQGTALESAANGIVITDPLGIIRWVNPAFTRLTGYSARAAIGKSTKILKSGTQDPLYYQDLWQTITQGKVWLGQLVNRRKNGTHYMEEMTITPVRDVHGTITHYISIKQDITARKAAEEKLRATAAQLGEQYREAEQARSEMRAILDGTSEAMVLISPDDRFLAVNRPFERFFARSAKKVVGLRFADLLSHVERVFEDPVDFKARLAHSARDSEREFTEILIQRWPQRRELQLFSTPVRKADGEHLGRLYVFHDVTHEREVDRMKSEFVSLVSHELRTPLTSIAGYIDLLVDGDAGPLNEEQAEYIAIAKRNGDRLATLVEDLLDVSRIESGAIKLKLSPLDLRPMIHGIAKSLRLRVEAKEQKLYVRLPKDLPVVIADADRVTQILTNLMSNAHKYTAKGGRISVTAHPGNERLRVNVRDTGIGLTREDRKKLFTKFFRAENPTTRDVSGTGLGLWITRSLVEMHNGRVRVSSSPGKGSTFSFTLPIAR